MAPNIEQRVSDLDRSALLSRRTLSAAWGAVQDAVRRDVASASTAGLRRSERGLAARSSTLDGGQIAGIVVGTVVGGSLILLVGFFLYFRYRRKRQRAADDLLPTKATATQRRLSYTREGYLPGQTEATHRDGSGSVKEDTSERGIPVLGDRNDFQQSPTAVEGPALVGDSNEFYTHMPAYQGEFTEEYDLSSPGRTTAPFGDDAAATSSTLEHTAVPGASNADYYNANVAMDSDPEQTPMAPPSRQMTEMYQEQLRMAREKRKGSKNSAFSRVMRTFKRKRSSRASDFNSEHGSYPASPIVQAADVPLASIETPPQKAWTAGIDASAPGGSFYAEPQEMGDGGAESDLHHSKKSKFHGASQDASSAGQQRIDSLRTALQTEPTPDPQLPSSALGQPSAPVPATSAMVTQAAQLQNRYRLNSPEIPSPMTVGAPGFSDDVDPSALRGSNSPPLAPETFVDPMAIMKPTTDTEKAAYNDIAWERWNSASPPVDHSSPEQAQPFPEVPHQHDIGEDDDADEDMDDDDDDDEEDSDSDVEMDSHSVEAPLQPVISYDGPSDYSTPPDHSSTNPSTATPDTRITSSPSPVNNEFIKPEQSVTPEVLTPASPNKGLTCEECGRTFDQIHKLNHHKRYHDRKHACTFPGCDKKFGTKTHLDRHINDKHDKKKGFHCTEPSCPYFYGGKAFPRKDNWRRHMQNKHGINPPTGPEPITGYPA